MPLALVAALFVALAAGAIAAAEGKRRPLLRLFKPAATLSLLLLVQGGGPPTTLTTLFSVGIVLSAAGDAALLDDGTRRFLLGLGFFLVAHAVFAAALWGAGGWQTAAAVALLLVALASAGLVVALWGRLPRGLRGPVVAYAAAITAMVGGACGAALLWPPPAAPAVALGAALFWISDGLLGWNRFRRRLPHGSSLILGTYWAGQLGLALAVRWAQA